MSSHHPYRSRTCGELREEHVGKTVRLSGWVHRVRDHGGIIFIDLRDQHGVTQIVVHPERDFYAESERWHLESVLCFTGDVVNRDPDTVNDRIATGTIEVVASEMEILGPSDPIPLPVAQELPCDENVRLRYRFLDLRRERMKRNILLRSDVTASVRRRLTDMGFREFQTPILTTSSPEGARDFLVPSRLHPGTFYALPQAPQIYKQLLMVGGFDRYFQIAPCFRDEDARADRSPGEFYQIDLEMAFATQDEIFEVVEELMHGVFSEFSSLAVTDTPFPRIPYAEAMAKYGCDKPDLRNPLHMVDVTDVFADSDFKAFAGVAGKKNGTVRAIAAKGVAQTASRKFYDDMIEFAQSVGAKGLGYIVFADGEARSPIANYLDEDRINTLRERLDVGDGDVAFFIADKKKKALNIAASVIPELGERLDLLEKDAYRLCWITDYPMYEYNEEHDRVDFSHNPFSMPQGGLEALNTKDPLDILAHQYDLVCNGVELSSGAIRNHRTDIMVRAFEIGGYTEEELKTQFSGLFRAFQYGAPPHGGIAPGLDRIIMLLTGEPNIREVIAFPLNQNAHDPLLGAPQPVGEKQLRELHIRTVLPKK